MPRSQGEGDSTLSAFARATDAAAAAVAFQRALAEEDFPEGIRLSVRAGMHTGEAQQDKGDYYGAAVSRAARVRGLAQGGQVYMSHATAELIVDQLPDGVTMHDVGRFALAGMAREEQVAELRITDLEQPASNIEDDDEDAELDTAPDDDLARSTVAFPSTLETDAPFVGREAELSTLRSWWAQSNATDRRHVVLLGGDAGMGKTRLTIEFARILHDEGGTVLAGRCYQENVVPYQPFVEAVGWYLRTAPAAEVRADLMRTGAHLTRLVPDVAGDFPDLPEPVQAEPDTQRYLMFEAVNDLLGTLCASAPVLIVLEDLHWADRPTLALLSHLARNRDAARLMILGTFRADEVADDHPLRALITELRRDHSVEEVELSGLDEGDVGRLCLVACAFTPDSEFVRSMRRETEGNPFFVREICSHVHEIGAANAGGGFTLESLGVPDGVKQVIGRRVEHLPEAAGRALSAAAVIGREFDLDLLIEITGDDEDDLLDLLDEAVAARVVEETSTQGLYSFVHALTREALHDSLSATRRARLHLPRRAGDRAPRARRDSTTISVCSRTTTGAPAARARRRSSTHSERASSRCASSRTKKRRSISRAVWRWPPPPAPPAATSCSVSPKRSVGLETSPARATRSSKPGRSPGRSAMPNDSPAPRSGTTAVTCSRAPDGTSPRSTCWKRHSPCSPTRTTRCARGCSPRSGSRSTSCPTRSAPTS